MKWMIDLDGVLAEFNQSFASEVGVPPAMMKQKGWPFKWNWPEDYLEAVKLEAVWDKIRRSRNFWEGLPEFSWTRPTLDLLWDSAAEGHEVYFVTSREGDDAKRQTERWLGKKGFPMPTVLVSSHGDKAGIAHDLDADVMIDDKPDVLRKVRLHAKHEIRLYLQVHSYNKHFALHDALGYKILPIESPVTAILSEQARRELYETKSCELCNGAGLVPHAGECPACKGTGKYNGNA